MPEKKKTLKKKVTKKTNKKANKKNIKTRKVIAILLFMIILMVIIILIMFSKLFNITKITVLNNSKVSKEEIVAPSLLVENQNMFKVSKRRIANSIKANAYIEDVKITKKFNGEVIIDVKERVPTYMLYCEKGYAYINNQGYILEVSDVALNLPVIKGYSTKDINAGNRLEKQDLEKLDIVIQIMDTANSKQIKEIITEIDITDKNNFILSIPSEKKTVQFGDESNINVKILWIIDIISRTKDVEGEIIVKSPDIKKAYFREKV